MNQRAYGLSRTNKPEFYGELQNRLTGLGYGPGVQNAMIGMSGPQNTTIYQDDRTPWNLQGFYIPQSMPSENVMAATRQYLPVFPEAANANPGDLFGAGGALSHEMLHRIADSDVVRSPRVLSVVEQAFQDLGGGPARAEHINRAGSAANEMFAYMFDPTESNLFEENPERYARMLSMRRTPTREQIRQVRERYLPQIETAIQEEMRARADSKINQRLDEMPRRGYPAP
jgi:hypothetical protein